MDDLDIINFIQANPGLTKYKIVKALGGGMLTSFQVQALVERGLVNATLIPSTRSRQGWALTVNEAQASRLMEVA
ncbi:MAG: hypothetical protein ACYC8W_07705 [Candidatus Tyrphobacter sp.]